MRFLTSGFFHESIVPKPQSHTKEDIALYRGAHFKDNEGFEAYWRQCEALLKKSRVPLLLPSIFAHVPMYCVSPTETHHRNQEYRAEPNSSVTKECQIFLSHELWAYWVLKKPEFYADFESVNIIGGKRGKTRFFFAKNELQGRKLFSSNRSIWVPKKCRILS